MTRTHRLQTLRKCLCAIATLAVLGSTVLAAPPGPPVYRGFEGTKFRGIGLGQSRAEVEPALAAIGRRCMANEELGPLLDHPQQATVDYLGNGGFVEDREGFTACRIVERAFVVEDRSDVVRTYDPLTEMVFDLPINAVSFVDDVATAILVTSVFFEADSMKGEPALFASAIAENYLGGRMAWDGERWRGITSAQELVEVIQYGRTSYPLLLVKLVDPASEPSFN